MSTSKYERIADQVGGMKFEGLPVVYASGQSSQARVALATIHRLLNHLMAMGPAIWGIRRGEIYTKSFCFYTDVAQRMVVATGPGVPVHFAKFPGSPRRSRFAIPPEDPGQGDTLFIRGYRPISEDVFVLLSIYVAEDVPLEPWQHFVPDGEHGGVSDWWATHAVVLRPDYPIEPDSSLEDDPDFWRRMPAPEDS